MEHLLSCEQLTTKDLDYIFRLTDKMRLSPHQFRHALSDKVVATLFYEPSTRTRLSFESAILRLGGKNISTENAKEMSSAIKGESLLDTIRVMHGYCDAIVLRHFETNSAELAASVSKVPIINAGSGSGEHPTQSLLDVYTIFKHKRNLNGLSVAVMGDLRFGRTVHSLIKILSLYDNITIYGLSREQFALPEDYIEFMKRKNMHFVPCSEIEDIPSDVDVLYHTRTQTERFSSSEYKIEEFIFTPEVMSRFSKDTILLHPLPRKTEISHEVDSDPRALYFEQTHNGLYVRMALLYMLLVTPGELHMAP